MNDLNAKAWLGLFFVAGMKSLLLFSVAGTVYYWQAWRSSLSRMTRSFRNCCSDRVIGIFLLIVSIDTWRKAKEE